MKCCKTACPRDRLKPFSKCAQCLETNRMWMKQEYDRRVRLGLCVKCRIPTQNNGVHCANHTRIHNNRRAGL
jgi:hypothetical protein